MPELKKSLGWQYLQETKFDRGSLLALDRPNIAPGPLYKTYPDAESVELPKPALPKADLQDALASRRSRRRFGQAGLSLEALSALLWASQGPSGRMGQVTVRTAPSAGALYPIETYMVIRNVEGLASGVYHWNLRDSVLERLGEGDFGPALARGCIGQSFMGQAAAAFCWSAVFRRNMSKYGHRGLRYILMDAGHVCQNLLLAAEALGLSACPVAALLDDELNGLLGLDGQEESVIYCAGLGSR